MGERYKPKYYDVCRYKHKPFKVHTEKSPLCSTIKKSRAASALQP